MNVPAPALPRRPSRHGLFTVVGVLAGAAIILGALTTFYTDLLWFKEMKFSRVFWTQFKVKVGLGVAFGAVFAVALLVNLWVVQRVTTPNRLFTLRDEMLERYRATLRPYVRWAVVGGSLLLGAFAGSGATGQWRSWLLYQNGKSFGTRDPLFNRDIGFYVFQFPFQRFSFTWAFSSLIVITLVTAGAHYLMGGIRLDQRGARATPQVKAHLSVLLGLLVLLKAWSYRLDQFGLLYSPRGRVTGASYTDVNAELPALRLLVIMALLVAVLFFVNIRVRGWTIPIAGIGLLFLTSALAGGVYPALIQRLRVTPIERQRETPFIQRNIQATRAAYGIDDRTVTTADFPGKGVIDKAMLDRNKTTIENIRLWRPDILLDTYSPLQRIRQYYDFLDVDVDRYPIGGDIRQVMLAPREIGQDNLTGSAASWLNTHLIYTHGNGVVASRVDKVTPQGQPVFVVKDVPPKSSEGMPVPKNTRIYFGEREQTPYVVVRTGVKELDYPTAQGKQFEENRYDGTGGVRLSGFLRRLAFAWRFRDANLMLSSAVKPESRLMFRRSVRERVERVAPFLKFDHDPYIVITGDRLLWVQDAYTTTDMYPYSEQMNLTDLFTGAAAPRGRINYIRNSVKATVDANDGTVTLYVVDPSDPIIRTWQRVFPESFEVAAAVPSDLQAHFRYPEDLFEIQSERFATYHVTDANSFYSKEDVWAVPTEPGTAFRQRPYYVLLRLPDQSRPEYVLVRPFTPSGRSNMTAFLAARSDPGVYGQLRSYVLPRQEFAPGPETVHTLINQHPQISQERTLFDTAGTKYIFGDLLSIPIDESFLHVQPIYLAATSGKLPELKRVAVVAGERVGVGETLEQALANLTGGRAVTPVKPTTPTGGSLTDLIAEAIQHYDAAQEALKKGDFATYGREQEAMAAALRRAGAATGASPSPSPTPTGG